MTDSEAADWNLRQATPDDIPAIQQLIAPYVAARKLLPRTDADLLILVRNGFVAESAGAVIGFVAIEIYSRKLAEVQCLAVSGEFQGRGIGRRLVQACIDRAREHQVWELMAISSSDDFLRICGFDYSLPDQKRALFIRTREV